MLDFLTKAFILKFLKFAAVGATGVIVDYGFTYLFKEKFKVHKYLANSIGFTIAASTNYVLNRIWTFESDNPDIAVEYGEFLVLSIIGLGLNNLLLWIFHSKFNLNFYVAKLIAIGFVTIWNFLANYFITFNQTV